MLAVEIAREGREGRKVGTLFVASDADEVLARSRSLILDPLYGHADDVKNIQDAEMRETVKELAQLDGAFIVTDDGVARSAARYIEGAIEDINLPRGLGSRHLAGASITHPTEAGAVVVSESSIVRVFDDGELVSEILPEFCILGQYPSLLGDDVQSETQEGTTVLSRRQ
jgi:DNA integrity scanning protein DisA with diadenylate cyclase activity